MSGMFDVSTPQKRERFLLIVGGIMLIVVVIVVFNFLFGSEVTRLRRQRDRMKEDIEKRETDVAQKDQIKRRLAELTTQSLPPGDSLAQSLYQNWLINTAYEVGMQNIRINPGSVSPFKDHYRKYTFTLDGEGTLEQVAGFLRIFHKTDYLHLVRRVTPQPIKDTNRMRVSVFVEALSLPQARPSRTLRKVPEDKLAITEQEKAILKTIVERNLFAAWQPPKPEGPKTEKIDSPNEDFDHSPYCYVIASVIDKDGKPQVWVNVRTEGKMYKLNEGGMFRLGGVRCFVRKIEEKQVMFEAAGGHYTVKVGKSFAEYE